MDAFVEPVTTLEDEDALAAADELVAPAELVAGPLALEEAPVADPLELDAEFLPTQLESAASVWSTISREMHRKQGLMTYSRVES